MTTRKPITCGIIFFRKAKLGCEFFRCQKCGGVLKCKPYYTPIFKNWNIKQRGTHIWTWATTMVIFLFWNVQYCDCHRGNRKYHITLFLNSRGPCLKIIKHAPFSATVNNRNMYWFASWNIWNYVAWRLCLRIMVHNHVNLYKGQVIQYVVWWESVAFVLCRGCSRHN